MIAIKYGRRSSRWVVSMDFTSKDLQPADEPTPAKAKTQRKMVGLVRSCEDWTIKNVEY